MNTRKSVALGMLVDASTSMCVIDPTETIDALNTMISDQTKENTVTFFGAKFSTTYTLFKDGVNGEDVTITEEDIHPNGMTALLDGIKYIIRDMSEKIKNKNMDSVVIIILTDGEENSSQDATREEIMDLIKDKKEVDSWKFMFLGANQDSIATGESLGMDKDSSCDFQYSSQGMSNVMHTVSSALTRSLDTGSAIYFDDDERNYSQCIQPD